MMRGLVMALVAGSVVCPTCAVVPTAKHVVLLVVDDLGFGDLGITGTEMLVCGVCYCVTLHVCVGARVSKIVCTDWVEPV